MPFNQPVGYSIIRIAKKEMALFFDSPVAYLFIGTFVSLTLFIFFWGEAFFARNIADIRPLFEWIPLLLIFLCAAITMRSWSEEKRQGTLEHILTQATPLWHFVLGKFLACWCLLGIALSLTLPLPITVSLMANLDWGPVFTGYLSTLCLGAMYLTLGLFVSSNSTNQIVSLIGSTLIGLVFYLIGSPSVLLLFSSPISDVLSALGSSTRFDSIQRGVIDFPDLYYYVSLSIVFTTCTLLSLEKVRWSQHSKRHHRQWFISCTLVISNVLFANIWLAKVDFLRIDMTAGNQYSLSMATQDYLNQLEEPLRIRGYFSGKTHPLLAPLVPQMKDLIKEYQQSAKGQINIEFIDPAEHPELEQQAQTQFGITPIPIQISDRYQSSIVSAYFHLLIQYGDQFEVIGFQELIDIKAHNETDVIVQLRNPEYDLTRGIKKVLYAYQAAGNLFDSLDDDVVLTAYVSANQALPQPLIDFKEVIARVAKPYQIQSNNRFRVNFLNPQANQGEIAQKILRDFGFQAMTTNLESDERFYFYLTLTHQDQTVQLPLVDFTEAEFERTLEAGIKRFSPGFTKTVALVTPQIDPTIPYQQQPTSEFTQLENYLKGDLNVIQEDLTDGKVASQADILVLLSPQNFNEQQRFAIDQFLMQGGSLIIASSPFSAQLLNQRLTLQPIVSGLEQWLTFQGFSITDSLVLDTQNTPFPVPVERQSNGYHFQELRLLNYPYFIDIRGSGLNQDHPITASLGQLSMAWASPIEILPHASDRNQKVTPLITSSTQSWQSSQTDIMPKVSEMGISEFSPDNPTQKHVLGVMSEGSFRSFYHSETNTDLETSNQSPNPIPAGYLNTGNALLSHSPASARILLLSSNDFLRDNVLELGSAAQQSPYTQPMALIANAIDFSLADTALMQIRARGYFNRTLPPMTATQQKRWEYTNYVLALSLLIMLALLERAYRRQKNKRYLRELNLSNQQN